MITPPLLIMSLQGKANVLYELGSYNHPSGSIQRLPQRFEFFHAPIIQNDPSPRCSQYGLLCWQPPAMDVRQMWQRQAFQELAPTDNQQPTPTTSSTTSTTRTRGENTCNPQSLIQRNYLFALESLKTFPLKVAEFVGIQDNLFRICPENLQKHAVLHQQQAPNKSTLSHPGAFAILSPIWINLDPSNTCYP